MQANTETGFGSGEYGPQISGFGGKCLSGHALIGISKKMQTLLQLTWILSLWLPTSPTVSGAE